MLPHRPAAGERSLAPLRDPDYTFRMGDDREEGTVFVVGRQVPNWRGPQKEGAHFSVDAGGAILTFFYARPQPKEVEALAAGRIRFGVVPAGDHTLFLLCAVEGMTEGWVDAPYALGCVHPEMRRFEFTDPDKGLVVTMMLVCARTGVLHGIRALTVTPQFTDALDAVIAGQRMRLGAFTRADHAAEVQAAYERWTTPAAMAAEAIVTETGGLPFHRMPKP